jgi:hypothetical protein
MLRLRRPAEPGEFATRVDAVRKKIANDVAGGKNPTIKRELWREFKPYFDQAQHGRCAYCELPVTAGQDGDVEHYAPKNDLRAFNGTDGEEGRELPNSARVKDRRPQLLSEAGYWWLAYEWRNYLLACRVCNSYWKGNLFPVRQPPDRMLPPTELAADGEVPLLLNPFEARDPRRHLRFNVDGTVEPRNRSVFGRETIRTCGLHRMALVDYRRIAARDAHAAVREAATARRGGAAPEDNQGLRDLHRMGKPDAYFRGVVRSIILQELGISWQELDSLFGQ